MNNIAALYFILILIFFIVIRDFYRKKYGYSSQILEVDGVPVSGYEEDYLLLDKQHTISMSDLLAQQGLKRISTSEVCAFQRREDDPDDYFLPVRKAYVSKNGMTLPQFIELNLIL